jgi:hypothetical protein
MNPLRRVRYEPHPPPKVGWWLTRVNRASRPSMRFWDGNVWSIGIPADAGVETIADRNALARMKSAHPQQSVRWTLYKPQWWVTATAPKPRRSKQ